MIHALVACAIGAFVLGLIAMLLRGSKVTALIEAPPGEETVEKVRKFNLKDTVDLYARYGWEIIERSPTAPSGINPEITITFRKAGPAAESLGPPL